MDKEIGRLKGRENEGRREWNGERTAIRRTSLNGSLFDAL